MMALGGQKMNRFNLLPFGEQAPFIGLSYQFNFNTFYRKSMESVSPWC